MSREIPVPTWKRTRQSPSPRPQLSRDVIVDTAIRLLDTDGLDGVSMRRVAEELGTGAASLYAHVANKEELLDLAFDKISGDVEVPVPDPARWAEQVRELAKSMHRTFTEHRDIAFVSLANVPTGPNALRVADGLLAILLAGGVPTRVAGWFLDRLALYITADAYEGSLYENRQRASGLDREAFVSQYFGEISSFYASLPPDRFPVLSANVEALMGGDGDERFDFGLDLMIRSLATYVPDSDEHAGQVPKISSV